MFFQDVTPDTSGYMIAGFVISFVVMGLYVASMYLRTRSLRQDQSLLEEMDREARSGSLGEKKYTTVTKKSTQK
ncbi:MAG TPA: hypothetical protein VFY26_16855 [Anaerolineales bacterium]|nr:hypothetical protein [Anaerolineales bacterium]